MKFTPRKWILMVNIPYICKVKFKIITIWENLLLVVQCWLLLW